MIGIMTFGLQGHIQVEVFYDCITLIGEINIPILTGEVLVYTDVIALTGDITIAILTGEISTIVLTGDYETMTEMVGELY